MNKKEKIQSEIDKTLEMFEQGESLPPNPYFYTRVKQSLDERSKKQSKISGVLKSALMTGLFLFNLTTIVWYLNGNETYTHVDSHQELVKILTADLNLEEEETDLFSIEQVIK